MWEVFDPRYGRPWLIVPSERLARFFAWLWQVDYERVGAGWV